jgi:ketosteroid isomerase-like protein
MVDHRRRAEGVVIMRRGLAAALVLACAGAPAGAHEPSKSASAQAGLSPAAAQAAMVVDAFHAALERGDTAAALTALADDALIYESGGVERGKAEYAAQHLAADSEFARAVPSTRTRRAGHVQGALAWIATEGRTTGVWKNKAIDRLTTETMLLRRERRGWMIVHVHWSSSAAPAR